MKIDDAWEAACISLLEDLGKDVFGTWIKQLTLTGFESGKVHLIADSKYNATFIKRTYGDKLLSHISRQFEGVKSLSIGAGALKKRSKGSDSSTYDTGGKFIASKYYRAVRKASPAKGPAQAVLLVLTSSIAEWDEPIVTFTKAQLVEEGVGFTCMKTLQAALRQLRTLGVISYVKGQRGGKGVPTTYKIHLLPNASERIERDLLAFYKSGAKKPPKDE